MTNLTNLTPADIGIIGAALDAAVDEGDDSAMDTVWFAIVSEDIASKEVADDLAYHVIHDLRRVI